MTIDVETELTHIRRIAAAPDDLGLRFAYADWLIARDDPRGYHVKAMTAYEQARDWERCLYGPYDHPDHELPGEAEEARELLDPHFTLLHRLAVNRWCLAWAAAGFVGLALAARRGTVSLPAWNGYHPMALGLHGGIPCALVFAESYLDSEELRDLAACPYLVTIRTLSLYKNLIDDDGAIALANSVHTPHLQLLDLDENQIGDEGARALLAMPAGCAISLSGNPISEPVLQALAARGARTGAVTAAG